MDDIERCCAEIADKIVPRYRDRTKPPLPCHGDVAKKWQAAWDGACIALGADPKRLMK